MAQARMDARDLMSIQLSDDDGEGMNDMNSIGHDDNQWERYWDDLSGKALDAGGVHQVDEGI